jgi:hypothetical protein
MKKHQKRVMWLAIIIMVSMGIYAPWTITWGPAGGVQTPGGHACIFNSPDSLPKRILDPIGVKVSGASQQISASFGLRLDVEKLLLQWALVGMVAYGVFASCKGKD